MLWRRLQIFRWKRKRRQMEDWCAANGYHLWVNVVFSAVIPFFWCRMTLANVAKFKRKSLHPKIRDLYPKRIWEIGLGFLNFQKYVFICVLFVFHFLSCRTIENKRKRLLQEHKRLQYAAAVRAVLKNPQYITDPEESGIPEKTGQSFRSWQAFTIVGFQFASCATDVFQLITCEYQCLFLLTLQTVERRHEHMASHNFETELIPESDESVCSTIYPTLRDLWACRMLNRSTDATFAKRTSQQDTSSSDTSIL